MQTTIVTSCNRAYLWGAILLIGSIRLSGGRYPIHVWSTDLTEDEQSLLRQFEDVTVIVSDIAHPHLIKPDAMLNVSTEYATWIDSDCMFLGHLDPLLIPRNEGMQIRFRATEENDMVFGKRHRNVDRFGSIPAHILSQWRHDINERDVARYQTQCVSNFISLHRKHFGILQRWKEQLQRIAIDPAHPVDNKSMAYFMTDESVLSSLLSFSHETPPISLYSLDRLASRRLIHFGQQLKPWKTWRFKHLRHYRHVIHTLESLRHQGYRLPEIPTSLNPNFKLLTFSQSLLRSACSTVKRHIGMHLMSLKGFARH